MRMGKGTACKLVLPELFPRMDALRINLEQCIINCQQSRHVYSEIMNISQGLQQDQSLAAKEFFDIATRGLKLMKECSSTKWLLKAVEIGDCPEHFVELHLDLHWSSNVLSWAGQEIGCDEFLDNLRDPWKPDKDRVVLKFGEEDNQSFVTKVYECRKNDKESLILKVNKMHGGQGSQEDLQLASILNDRIKRCPNPSIPRDLESFIRSFKFKIYAHELFQHVRGGSSYIVKHRWVYKKEFVLKLAIKPSEEANQIKKEAEIMEKCRHPYIVGVVGWWKINSKSMVMMESLKCTLRQLMKNEMKKRKRASRGREGFSAAEVINLLLPVAKAIRNLHGKDIPIAHRDIKPDNIMCSEESEDATKLIDFGDSVEFDHNNIIRRYDVAGTTGYMAPEVRKCTSTYCDLLKADVFSFGMVFGELLTWKMPEEALYAQAKETLSRAEFNDLLERGWRPQIPHDVPVFVAFIVESCWRKYPSSRPGFGDICLMLQNAQVLLRKLKPDEDVLSVVSYTDSDGTDWPITGKFSLREMLNLEGEVDSEGILCEVLKARRGSGECSSVRK